MCRLCGAKCERELRSVYGDRWLLIYCIVVPCACVFVCVVYVSFLVNISMLQRYCFYCVHVCQSVLTYWTFRCTEIDYRVGVTTLSGGGGGGGKLGSTKVSRIFYGSPGKSCEGMFLRKISHRKTLLLTLFLVIRGVSREKNVAYLIFLTWKNRNR